MKTTFTLEEAVENHRKLWREIARILREEDVTEIIYKKFFYYSRHTAIKIEAMRNIYKNKYENNDIQHNCFLCEYSFVSCKKCPLYDRKGRIGCLNGRYAIFRGEICYGNYKEAADVASEIAELPIVNI